MRLRTGAHHLRVETERWKKPRLPRSQRVCEKCTWGGTVEDEFHLLFECPRYHHIRLKYERDLFADFGGATGVERVTDRSWEGPDIHGAGTEEGGCICVGVFGISAN